MMCVGMFIAILDVQVVVTSLPTIQNALDIRPEQMSWVQTAYLIAEIIAIPLTGFLTRLLAMRRLFVVAISVFTMASLGCAFSGSFNMLVAWRILQGFSGGTLIPSVFSAVFLLFPKHRQDVATMLAGVLAVLAPTIGPITGGWITQTFSWHGLFLINVVPGIVSAVVAGALLPKAPVRLSEILGMDFNGLVFMAIALTALELALKQAPHHGWGGGQVIGLMTLSAICLGAFIRHTLRAQNPIINLRSFYSVNFTVGCVLSFVFGIGLFGSVYLMPVFLAFVRDHNALGIGAIMLVTGMAQLLSAPVSVLLERRLDARLLTAAGFGVFAVGLGLSATQTPRTDFDGMFWPQALRGIAILFCLLPLTRLALGNMAKTDVDDASGLFNLMRNLGGAIGLALIDTVIYSRTAIHGLEIMNKLQVGDIGTAKFIGLPLEYFPTHGLDQNNSAMVAMARPLIEKAALVQSINDAWAMLAVLTLAALVFLPFARKLNR